MLLKETARDQAIAGQQFTPTGNLEQHLKQNWPNSHVVRLWEETHAVTGS